MDWLDGVVKVEADTTDPNIYDIFSQCGEVVALRSCKTSIPGKAHFFIKFKDNQSRDRAINLKIDVPGIRVYSISEKPHFIHEYHTLLSNFHNENGPGIASNSQNIIPAAGVLHDHGPRKRKVRSRRTVAGRRQPQNTLPPSPDPLPSRYPRTVKNSILFQSLKTSQARISSPSAYEMSEQSSASDNASSRTPFPPYIQSCNFSSAMSPGPPNLFPPSLSVSRPDIPTPAASLPLIDRLSLSICGEIIVCDLKSFESDTRAIIELLKIAASDRGNWMIVGAYYRRSGNAQAAIAVMQSMIEGDSIAAHMHINIKMRTAMTQNGITEDGLKPAFLLLSGSETDLAKRAKLTNATSAEKHYRNSRMWLQKVYGMNDAPPDCNTLNIEGNAKEGHPANTRQPTNDLSAASRPGPSVSSSIKQTSSAPENSQKSILEREIQSLRDQRSEQATLLSLSRASKRKLEDDIAFERDLRRRIQRHLGDAERERDAARKMETFALDQAKREVDARRKAEEAARTERRLRMELQRTTDKRATQPLFEVANMIAQPQGASATDIPQPRPS